MFIGIFLVLIGLLLISTPMNALTYVLPGGLSVTVWYGMRMAKSWAWILGLWTGVVYIVLGVLSIGIIFAIFGALTIYYFSRSDLKKYLGKSSR